jgi:hypothetical protein
VTQKQHRDEMLGIFRAVELAAEYVQPERERQRIRAIPLTRQEIEWLKDEYDPWSEADGGKVSIK